MNELKPKDQIETSGEPPADINIDESQLQSEPQEPPRAANWLQGRLNRLQSFWSKKGPKEKFAYLILAILLLGGGVFWWIYAVYDSPSPAIVSYVPHGKPKPKTVPSPLTGLQVTPKLAARPVTAIMIENSDGARPQSGLQDAGIVFEAIAEGGVTRFMALYQDATPQYIGPVRSLRPYYLDFAAPFEASIAHVGGSPDALARVRNGQYRDIDEFFNAGAYWRISSRYAPHNVYTSFAKLDALNKSKHYTSSEFTPWPRKPDKKLKKPTAASIDIHISGPDYYVHYDYNPKTNTYARYEAGAKHLDLVDAAGKIAVQLQPKVVIAVVLSQSVGALDASGAYYTDYQDVGSGQAYVFQDGGVTKVIWKKNGADLPLQLISSTGQPFKLDAGQTWVTAIGASNLVSYKP